MKRPKYSSTRLKNFFRRKEMKVRSSEFGVRNIRIILLMGCLLVSFTAFSSRALAEKVILKIGTLAPEGSTWVKTFREINRELVEKTRDQVAIRIFPGGILGDEEDMLRKIKVGQIQG